MNWRTATVCTLTAWAAAELLLLLVEFNGSVASLRISKAVYPTLAIVVLVLPVVGFALALAGCAKATNMKKSWRTLALAAAVIGQEAYSLVTYRIY
jgi:hypothetical protein